ncbi:MAG: hypothetical protein K2K87_12150 [Lachnospiraceae bacterium]|nr:hypothetical protein [Lachnospiraceae bacterium]
MSRRQESFQEQIERFYKKELQKYEQVRVGNTPDYLINFGAGKLPVFLNQSTIGKIVREPRGQRSAHAMARDIVEKMPQILSEPALLIINDAPHRIALLSEKCNQYGCPLLMALELKEKGYNKITSFYGRENCKVYLERQENVTIIDMEKAKQLSRLLGLQLPMAWKALDYSKTILDPNPPVKNENQNL